jgi:hypothetical protein
MIIKNLGVAALLCVAALFCTASLIAQDHPGSAPAPPSWKPLEFLMGTWEAKTQGDSAASATGTYIFQPELRGHVLARHSSSATCKGPADFDCEHGDLLYIYQDVPEPRFRAIYFDNEGHAIHYDVSSPAPNVAIFLSNSSQPGPQYRLSYELRGSIMYGKFQMRMPGQTEFKSYLEWSGTKQKGRAQ